MRAGQAGVAGTLTATRRCVADETAARASGALAGRWGWGRETCWAGCPERSWASFPAALSPGARRGAQPLAGQEQTRTPEAVPAPPGHGHLLAVCPWAGGLTSLNLLPQHSSFSQSQTGRQRRHEVKGVKGLLPQPWAALHPWPSPCAAATVPLSPTAQVGRRGYAAHEPRPEPGHTPPRLCAV